MTKRCWYLENPLFPLLENIVRSICEVSRKTLSSDAKSVNFCLRNRFPKTNNLQGKGRRNNAVQGVPFFSMKCLRLCSAFSRDVRNGQSAHFSKHMSPLY